MQISNVERTQSLSIMLLKQLRPKQWTKNILVFAALVFSPSVYDLNNIYMVLLGFVLFSLVSSCVYIVNDYMDIEVDRKHPTKRFRPMASGALNPQLTLIFGGILLISCLTCSLILSIPFALLLALYFLINVAYSINLKHVVILDVMIVASGFVLRAIGGGLIINVKLTPWFLICTMLLSLFLAISKRRGEFMSASENSISQRKVLKFYNKDLLDQMNTIVITSTIISYSLFTFTSGKTVYLMWTIPIVLYGIFRYLYLIHVEGKGESPDKILFEDRHILISAILYAISVIFILNYFK
jgi:4-hydroxybenzoate polyprenyltransferase